MCGRYILINGRKVFATFELLKELERKNIPYMEVPRYNASPMQKMPIVVVRKGELTTLDATWWLVPHWSTTGKPDPAIKAFNTRAEGILQSKLFSPYFKARRCLIPADGFYEWKKIQEEIQFKGKLKKVESKTPVCIRMKDEKPFFFGGIWSVWKDQEEHEHPSFSIITTTPNELMESIHNRMPVILPEQHFKEWLDPAYTNVEALQKKLIPFPSSEMKAYTVSAHVSNSRNDDAACIKPLEEQTDS